VGKQLSQLLLARQQQQQLTLSNQENELQEVLEEDTFLRVHRQYIINLNHVKGFNRKESVLTMDSGHHIPLARNQKEKLIEKYKWL
jgi:two-component system LytT family response regulator